MGTIRMCTLRSGRFGVGRMWLTILSDDRSKPALNDTTRIFGERVRNRRLALDSVRTPQLRSQCPRLCG